MAAMTEMRVDALDAMRQMAEAAPPLLPPLGEREKRLFAAAASGDAGAVRALLADGADPNARQPSTRISVLSAAADVGNGDAVRALLETRANNGKGKGKVPPVLLRLRDVRGRTALHVAAEAGHVAIARMLVEAWEAADDEPEEGQPAPELDLVDEQDTEGRTALMLAARAPADHVVQITQYLLDPEGGNAAVNMTDADGRTALMFAAERGIDALADLYLSHPGTDAAKQAKGGFTAAVMAAVHGHPDLARKLMAVQKAQEAENEAAKRAENVGEAKGKSKKAKKAAPPAEEPAVAADQPSATAEVVRVEAASGHGHLPHSRRTLRLISAALGAQDAGSAAERKAARIRAAVREARAVAAAVAGDFGWEGKGEVVAVEEMPGRGLEAGADGLEVAVTLAF
ncbi:ankyrin repeat-containing domain protein [Hyaloraphidium curvatum]|nr:ankyrin repeat-containing domain protein [Hyaloraphidium curvatum]